MPLRHGTQLQRDPLTVSSILTNMPVAKSLFFSQLNPLLSRREPPQSKLDRWVGAGAAAPAPPEVKREVLRRYGFGTWIETGTYEGDTTAFLSDLGAPHVFSIEPSLHLCNLARIRFADNSGVTVIHGLSEELMPSVISGVAGEVSFWLDGHYSGGQTFRGENDTPIRQELSAISSHLPRLSRVSILIDDFRLFGSAEHPAYPSKSWLVKWADDNELNWTVEHDIFVTGTDV